MLSAPLSPFIISHLFASQLWLLASTILVFLLLHCLICRPPVLYSNDAQNISQRDVLSEEFFSDQMKNVTYSERVDMIL